MGCRILARLEILGEYQGLVSEKGPPPVVVRRPDYQGIPVLLDADGVGVKAEVDRNSDCLVAAILKDFCFHRFRIRARHMPEASVK